MNQELQYPNFRLAEGQEEGKSRYEQAARLNGRYASEEEEELTIPDERGTDMSQSRQ